MFNINFSCALLGCLLLSTAINAVPLSISYSLAPSPTGIAPTATREPNMSWDYGSNVTICTGPNMSGNCITQTPLLSLDYNPNGAIFCNSLNGTKEYGLKGSSFNMTAALNSPKFLAYCTLYESPTCYTVSPSFGDPNTVGLRHSMAYSLGSGMMDWEEDWNWGGYQCWQERMDQKVKLAAKISVPELGTR